MRSKRFFILAASCVAFIVGLALSVPTVPAAHADGPTPTPTGTPASGGGGGTGGNGNGGGTHG